MVKYILCNILNGILWTNTFCSPFVNINIAYTPVFLWGSCCSIFSFLCNVLQIIVCTFVFLSFYHCIVCSSIYVFWLPIRYLTPQKNGCVSYIYVYKRTTKCICSQNAIKYLLFIWSFGLLFFLSISSYLISSTFVFLSFYHCIVCSSIYVFWLPIRYLQTFLSYIYTKSNILKIATT
jgi:hypothetical protein